MSSQVHVADVYPLAAPNGSQIIVCGHEGGLLILWRGGRPFKSSKGPSSQLRRNESSSGVVSVDSDGNANIENRDDAEFAQEEEDFDASRPYADITQRLDLPIGSAVLHLAFPPLPQLAKPERHPFSPSLLQRKLVVAFACADNSVRLLTLPLTPPSPSLVSSKRLFDESSRCMAGRGTWGEELVTISGAHQSLPKGVSVAFVRCAITRADEEDSEDSMDDDGEKTGYDILLASHSADLSGLVLIHRIPVIEDGTAIETSLSEVDLWRSRPLATPASSIDLYVSPSSASSQSSPSPRLVVGESNGPVRIFECCSSNAPDQGSWTSTLYPPISLPRSGHTRTVVDARWVLGGKAVAVLTSEGEWGLWDISMRGSARMIPGSKPTPFAISGRVGSSIKNTAGSKNSVSSNEPKSQLAPMTPSTRKVRQEALFGVSKDNTISNRGGISLKYIRNSPLGGDGDESMTLWHDTSAFTIPSLRSHWQMKFVKGGGSYFNSGAAGQIQNFPTVDLGGELRVAVSTFPKDDSFSTTNSKQVEVLVAGERSLTILAPPPSAQEETTTTALVPVEAKALLQIQPRESIQPHAADQMLLDHGELDVQGLDRVMMDMGGTAPVGIWSPTPTEKRRIGSR